MSLHRNSVHAQIAAMAVGDYKWIETTASEYAYVQKVWNLPKHRRTEATRDFVIKCSVWRAVPCSMLDAVKVLVRVERTA